jgi:hypothetical protein
VHDILYCRLCLLNRSHQLLLSISIEHRTVSFSAHTLRRRKDLFNKIKFNKIKKSGGGGRSAPFGVSTNLKRRVARSARARKTAKSKTTNTHYRHNDIMAAFCGVMLVSVSVNSVYGKWHSAHAQH